MSEQSTWFVCRVTLDCSQQMDVLRYIMTCKQYRTAYIIHDKDVALAEDVGKEYTDYSVTEEGEKRTYVFGQPKPVHAHVLIKTPRKLTEKGFTTRFAGYVNMLICHDPVESAFYLTHDTFKSKDKAKYSFDDIKGDMDMIKELRKDAKADDFVQSIKEYRDALECSSGSPVGAVQHLVNTGKRDAIKSIMSHPYFYKTFCTEEV